MNVAEQEHGYKIDRSDMTWLGSFHDSTSKRVQLSSHHFWRSLQIAYFAYKTARITSDV